MSRKDWLSFSRYAVWGAGRSGLGAANLLARRGKRVLLSDLCSDEEFAERELNLEKGVLFRGGRNWIEDAELIVVSPGLKPGLPVFDEAKRAGLPVISEVELAMAASEHRWIGITGTDGKSTTTSLVGAILDGAGIAHVVAGNIGVALTDVVEEAPPEAVIVAELSANQLWTCESIDAAAATITNFADDHMDYFRSLQEYWEAKTRLFAMQDGDGRAVLPLNGGPRFQSLLEELRSEERELVFFGVGGEAESSEEQELIFFDETRRGIAREGGEEFVWLEDFADVNLLGTHNQKNCACAAALARGIGVSWEAIGKGLLHFRGLPHRMEMVRSLDGVRYVDDSKATNPHASLAGIAGLEGEVVVIAGGLDKGLPLEEWAREVARRARAVILIGALQEKLSEMLSREGMEARLADSLEEAVKEAQETAKPGSTVLLSPASSSYDMFESYVHRGQVFQKAVHALE